MPRDLDGLADVVVLTVKTALAPVLERLAVSEERNRELQARVDALTELRDRLTVVETKSAVVVAPQELHQSVDLGPVLERVAAAEARLSVLGDLRDRVVTVETKAALAPTSESVGFDAAPLLARLDTLEVKAAPLFGSVAELTKDIGAIRERVAVVEVRAPIPGPPGANGKDGERGKDGLDGLGFDDIDVDFDGDRTLAVKFTRGDRVKSFPITLPYQRQQGVYQEGKSYTVGDVVTWGGSQWHCNEDTTTKPGDGSKAWTLIVKRGRDGKDGRDAMPLPIVKVGGR